MPNETHPAPVGAPRGLKIAGAVATIVAIGVVAAGTMTRASQVQAAQAWSDSRAAPTVHLVAAQSAAGSDPLTLPGTMQAWNAARLFPRVEGYVTAWYKDIGTIVPAGSALGHIDTPELDQQIVQARADLASARANAALSRSTAARWNDLLTTHSVSAQEADEKNGDLAAKVAGVQGAQANLDRLLAQKDYATVRAPFAGVVTLRNAEIGDLVGPSSGAQQPMFAMADVHRIRLYVSVPQSYSAAMKQGLDATLSVPDYPGRSFTAQVIGTSGAINTQSGTLQVQLVADNPGNMLKPGGYAQVRFDVAGRAGIVVVPSSVLVFRAAGMQVALVDGQGHVQMREVAIGRDMGGTVDILTGLKPGERIIDNPPDSIAQGEQVRVDASHA